MKSNIENLRETINKTVEERIVPLLKTIDNEERLCKVLDLCSDTIHHTCTGMDVNNIIPIFEEIEKELDVDLEVEKIIISKDVAKAAIDITEHEKMIKEILAKRTCRSRKPVVIEEEDDNGDKNIDQDDVTELFSSEIEDFFKDVSSKLNPNGNMYKNALACLSDLNVDSDSIIELRAKYDESNNESLFASLKEFVQLFGFEEHIKSNKDKLQGVDLSNAELVEKFMETYMSTVPGTKTLIEYIKDNMFKFTGDTILDGGSALYNMVGNDSVITQEQVKDYKGRIDTEFANLIKFDPNSTKEDKLNSIFKFVSEIINLDMEAPQQFILSNSSIISKFPKLEQIEKIYHANKCDVEMKEIKDGLIKCIPFELSKGEEIDEKLVIDLNGNIIDRSEKVFLLDKSQTHIEDCICVKLSNTAAIKQFISKGLSKDLESLDEFDEHIRNFNKVIDMSTLPKNNKVKEAVIEFIKDNCTTHIDKAVNKDANVRFKVIDFKDAKNFKLTSNNVPVSVDSETKSKINFKIEVKDGKVTSK